MQPKHHTSCGEKGTLILTIICCLIHNHTHGQGKLGFYNTDRLKTGRLRPNCRLCVFYLFTASLYMYIGYLCSGSSSLAVSFYYNHPLIRMMHFFAEGFCAKVILVQAGFLWLEFICCFATCLGAFYISFAFGSVTHFLC